MWLAWGEQLTFFCNDAYRRDTLGSKYPWALGRPATEVWAEIWPEIGPRIERVLAGGDATWDEGLLLFLERSGYIEETYHTFSYGAVADEDGRIAGMLCVVSEDTHRVIAQHRLGVLQALSERLVAANTEADVFDAFDGVFDTASGQRSVPFSLLYFFNEDGSASLAAHCGIDVGHYLAPAKLDAPESELVENEMPWPVSVAKRGAALTIELNADHDQIPTGAWDMAPRQARLIPLIARAGEAPFGFLVAAVSPHRALDEDYLAFLGLIGGQLAAGMAAARSYEAEQRRAQELAELDKAKTAFFTNVSHEFRTPLTLMLGPIEELLVKQQADPLPDSAYGQLEIVQRNAERLLKLVNSLLEFSRLESGLAQPERQPIDLAVLTAQLSEGFRHIAEQAGLELVVDCPPLPVLVPVDVDMWTRIVLNLLSNAFKFTTEGRISVELSGTEDHVELKVIDTGIGIASADQTRLFERFHRVQNVGARSHEGSGIGLALVAELAAAHDGTVNVESEPGSGSTFTVTLPIGAAAVAGFQRHEERR